jgi:hypothetical protein
VEANKFDWPTQPGNDLVAQQLAGVVPFDTRFPFDPDDRGFIVTIRPMEVMTFLAAFD